MTGLCTSKRSWRSHVFAENFEVYGVRNVWRQLQRESFDVARCTGAIDVIKQDQPESVSVRFGFASTFVAGRAIAAFNRSYWRMLFKMYRWAGRPNRSHAHRTLRQRTDRSSVGGHARSDKTRARLVAARSSNDRDPCARATAIACS